MPIFISYSRKDSEFADRLAVNLIRNRHHIWMDRWELKVGDSLIDKIQAALIDSSAVIVVLSKNSVDSEWCKKELNASLVRELSERKALLLPCVIDDCEIPLFLREKFYADFRTDPDKGLSELNDALAQFSNTQQGRIENPTFHTDWSYDWKEIDGRWCIDFVFVEHGHDWPYVVLSRCFITCNEIAETTFSKVYKDEQKRHDYIRDLLLLILSHMGSGPHTDIISDAFEKFRRYEVDGGKGQRFLVTLSFRRMGIDNGMDTVVHWDLNLRKTFEYLNMITAKP